MLVYTNIKIYSENVTQKNIPKNNKLFLRINCTQRSPIIELFLERFREIEGLQ